MFLIFSSLETMPPVCFFLYVSLDLHRSIVSPNSFPFFTILFYPLYLFSLFPLYLSIFFLFFHHLFLSACLTLLSKRTLWTTSLLQSRIMTVVSTSCVLFSLKQEVSVPCRVSGFGFVQVADLPVDGPKYRF